MLKTKRQQYEFEIDELKKELAKTKVVYNYNTGKIEDDFNVLNQILNLKTSHYENIIFVFNRYQEEKKVNVKTEEIDKATKDIIYESFQSLSDVYIDYLVKKYFSSKEAMVDTYTQQVYLRLFGFANNYNMTMTQANYNKKKE